MRLRSLLLAWVLGPTLALWSLALGLGYLHQRQQANEAFDRALLGSAMVLAERLHLQDGLVVADLSPAALEMLRTDAHDRVFYRIFDLDRGQHVTGYAELPLPAAVPAAPLLYDGRRQEQAVRIVALKHEVLDGERVRSLLVQVAETEEARRLLTQRQVLQAAAVQLALIALAAVLIAFGVRRGLAPLKQLRAEVRARRADDLTPIGTRDVPREVAPLIHAINAHTQRQRQLSELQGRFVANASHQLKTPLTLLRAQIDHALQQDALPAMRGVLMQAHESALGTQRLVSQMLSLARSEVGPADAAAVDMSEQARDVCLEAVPLARARQIDLAFDGKPSLWVSADAVLLREAVANLVHNAIAYTPPGGVITVTVELAPEESRDGAAPRAPPRAVLGVNDTGPGIPPGERVQVLERFYRRPGAGSGGSGLGLSIVQEICRRHGAELILRDGRGGQGLLAELHWPLARQPPSLTTGVVAE